MYNKEPKILYLAYTYPYPTHNGGTIGIANHIEELSQTKFAQSILFYFSKLDNNIKTIPANIPQNYKIFPPNVNPSKRFYKIMSIFFSKYTYYYNAFYTDKMAKSVKEYNPDIIIADSILSYKLIKKIKFKKQLIYIAHNIEYDYSYDFYRIEKNIFKKPFLLLNSIKTKFIEKNICEQADQIVCISTSDYKILKSRYPQKTTLNVHKINLSKELWQNPISEYKTLFFCGSTEFTPNYDALKWIVEELAPVLPPNIKIKIAGKGTDNLPSECLRDNIEFLGFVSKDELINLYKKSTAFICPIIYGSGVKIKVTEALSFGMPIIATKEALEGLDYIDIPPLIDRNNIKQTKNNIENLLNDRENLQEYSLNLIHQIKKYQQENKISLEKIIEKCI